MPACGRGTRLRCGAWRGWDEAGDDGEAPGEAPAQGQARPARAGRGVASPPEGEASRVRLVLVVDPAEDQDAQVSWKWRHLLELRRRYMDAAWERERLEHLRELREAHKALSELLEIL